MIKCLIITYDNVGKVLLKRANIIVGQKTDTKALEITSEMTEDEISDLIYKKTKDLSHDTLILTDLFGSNHARSIFKMKEKIKVLSGINLQMVISSQKALLRGETDLENIISTILKESQDSIYCA
jgi:mannose/fructose-specific phosphotransferase system component IIA